MKKVMKCRTVRAILMFATLLVYLLLLTGCKASSKAPLASSTVYITDTVRTADTLWRDRYVARIIQNISNTVKSKRDSVATVVDEQGNVKRTDSWHWSETSTATSMEQTLRDSLKEMKLRYTQLLGVKVEQKEVPVPIERDLTIAEKIFITIGHITTVFIIFVVVSLLIWLIHRKR